MIVILSVDSLVDVAERGGSALEHPGVIDIEGQRLVGHATRPLGLSGASLAILVELPVQQFAKSGVFRHLDELLHLDFELLDLKVVLLDHQPFDIQFCLHLVSDLVPLVCEVGFLVFEVLEDLIFRLIVGPTHFLYMFL